MRRGAGRARARASGLSLALLLGACASEGAADRSPTETTTSARYDTDATTTSAVPATGATTTSAVPATETTARPAPPSLSAWDSFDRSNRPINGDTAPSGQRWLNLDSLPPLIGAARIQDGALVSDPGVNAYSLLDVGDVPGSVSMELTFTEGSTFYGSAGMHVSTVATTGQVAALNGVHGGTGPATYAIGYGQDRKITNVATGIYAKPLTPGVRYRMTYVFSGDRLEVRLPAANNVGQQTLSITDPTLLSKWGRYVVLQHFKTGAHAATDQQPVFQSVAASTGRTAGDDMPASVSTPP